MQFSESMIILFAREPQPGKVKTRLIPVLGEDGACRLYTQLLDHALNTIIQAKISRLEICITPESQMDYFLLKNSPEDTVISRQIGNDLGKRMYHAMQSALNQYAKVVLIGSDCPFLDKNSFQQAMTALDSYDMVFSPASDGGYVLVGANVAASKVMSPIFEKIQWGSDVVMQQTRNALSANHVSWKELPVQHDIDQAEDLDKLSVLPEFKQWTYQKRR